MNDQTLIEAFQLFDKNGDGSIASDELMQVLDNLHLSTSKQEVNKMIASVDKDGNGRIELNEFIQMMKTRSRGQVLKKETELRSLFQAFDKDGSGYIDKSEVKKTMANVGLDLKEEDLEKMMKVAGVEKFDKIFYEDFVQLMTETLAKKQLKKQNKEPPRLLFSPDDRSTQDLRVTFSMFDKDGDGKITVDEVHKTLALLNMNLDYESAVEMVKQVDLDGNGTICFEEFEQLMKNYAGSSSSIDSSQNDFDLLELFKIFDKDKDGYLNASDLKNTMQQLGIELEDDDLSDMMRAVEVKEGGLICYGDFKKIFMYQNRNKMSRYSSMQSINTNLKNTDREGLQAVFSLFDKDGDGSITMEEVMKVLESMNIKSSPDYVQEIFQQVDLDGNGQIDFEEFILLTSRHDSPLSDEKEIEEMFSLIDKDKSGSLEAEELKSAFNSLGVPINNQDVKTMLRQAGVQGNIIYFEDFVRIMKSLDLSSSSLKQTPNRQKSSNSTSSANSQNFLSVPNNHIAKNKSSSVDKKDSKSLNNTKSNSQVSLNSQSSDKRTTTNQQQKQNAISPPPYSSISPQPLPSSPSTSSSSSYSFSSHPSSSPSKDLWVPLVSQRRRRFSSTTWEAFKLFDKNGDGYISKNELYATMKTLNIDLVQEDLDQMMRQADINGDGKIDYSEFTKLMMGTFSPFAEKAANLQRKNSNTPQKPSSLPSLEEMRASFKIFDINEDGFIDEKELRDTFVMLGKDVGEQDLHSLFSSADTNNDGKIDFQEFVNVLRFNEGKEFEDLTPN